jgi:Mg-chelatase subunit ChlD
VKILILILFSLVCNAQGCLKLDVVLLVDVSSSVEDKKEFIVKAVNTFNTRFENTDVHTSLITFSNGAELKYHLGKPEISMIICFGMTNLVPGLFFAEKEFEECGRENYRKMIILISDGKVDYEKESVTKCKLLQQKDITIVGILVKSEDTNEEFMKKVCDTYVESEYESLADELMRLDICM